MHKSILFRIVVLLFVLATLIYLGVMAYLGTFTRYMADDYCETYLAQTDSPLGAVINRYEEWSMARRKSLLESPFCRGGRVIIGKEKFRDHTCGIDVSLGTWFDPSGAAGTHIGRASNGIFTWIFFWEPRWLSFPFWKRPIVFKYFTGVPAWQPTLCL